MANVGSLLLLVCFIYTVLGVNMFAEIKLNDNYNYHANFMSFGRGFLLLIRASTGEAWDLIMKEVALGRSITH